MEWMAELIDSHYKIVRYWFHCRVNFEAINKAMQAKPNVGVLMPGIDNWYELEYFTHPLSSPAHANARPSSVRAQSTTASQRASCNRKALSTGITKQQTKQTIQLSKPVTSKGRASYVRATQESSDDNLSDNNSAHPDPRGKSVVRGQCAPSASKKRHSPSSVDQCETPFRKHIRLATPALYVHRTMGLDVDMRDMDTVDREPLQKLSRYSSTHLKNIQVTVEIPVFQRRELPVALGNRCGQFQLLSCRLFC